MDTALQTPDVCQDDAFHDDLSDCETAEEIAIAAIGRCPYFLMTGTPAEVRFIRIELQKAAIRTLTRGLLNDKQHRKQKRNRVHKLCIRQMDILRSEEWREFYDSEGDFWLEQVSPDEQSWRTGERDQPLPKNLAFRHLLVTLMTLHRTCVRNGIDDKIKPEWQHGNNIIQGTYEKVCAIRKGFHHVHTPSINNTKLSAPILTLKKAALLQSIPPSIKRTLLHNGGKYNEDVADGHPTGPSDNGDPDQRIYAETDEHTTTTTTMVDQTTSLRCVGAGHGHSSSSSSTFPVSPTRQEAIGDSRDGTPLPTTTTTTTTTKLRTPTLKQKKAALRRQRKHRAKKSIVASDSDTSEEEIVVDDQEEDDDAVVVAALNGSGTTTTTDLQKEEDSQSTQQMVLCEEKERGEEKLVGRRNKDDDLSLAEPRRHVFGQEPLAGDRMERGQSNDPKNGIDAAGLPNVGHQLFQTDFQHSHRKNLPVFVSPFSQHANAKKRTVGIACQIHSRKIYKCPATIDLNLIPSVGHTYSNLHEILVDRCSPWDPRIKRFLSTRKGPTFSNLGRGCAVSDPAPTRKREFLPPFDRCVVGYKSRNRNRPVENDHDKYTTVRPPVTDDSRFLYTQQQSSTTGTPVTARDGENDGPTPPRHGAISEKEAILSMLSEFCRIKRPLSPIPDDHPEPEEGEGEGGARLREDASSYLKSKHGAVFDFVTKLDNATLKLANTRHLFKKHKSNDSIKPTMTERADLVETGKRSRHPLTTNWFESEENDRLDLPVDVSNNNPYENKKTATTYPLRKTRPLAETTTASEQLESDSHPEPFQQDEMSTPVLLNASARVYHVSGNSVTDDNELQGASDVPLVCWTHEEVNGGRRAAHHRHLPYYCSSGIIEISEESFFDSSSSHYDSKPPSDTINEEDLVTAEEEDCVGSVRGEELLDHVMDNAGVSDQMLDNFLTSNTAVEKAFCEKDLYAVDSSEGLVLSYDTLFANDDEEEEEEKEELFKIKRGLDMPSGGNRNEMYGEDDELETTLETKCDHEQSFLELGAPSSSTFQSQTRQDDLDLLLDENSNLLDSVYDILFDEDKSNVFYRRDQSLPGEKGTELSQPHDQDECQDSASDDNMLLWQVKVNDGSDDWVSFDFLKGVDEKELCQLEPENESETGSNESQETTELPKEKPPPTSTKTEAVKPKKCKYQRKSNRVAAQSKKDFGNGSRSLRSDQSKSNKCSTPKNNSVGLSTSSQIQSATVSDSDKLDEAPPSQSPQPMQVKVLKIIVESVCADSLPPYDAFSDTDDESSTCTIITRSLKTAKARRKARERTMRNMTPVTCNIVTTLPHAGSRSADGKTNRRKEVRSGAISAPKNSRKLFEQPTPSHAQLNTADIGLTTNGTFPGRNSLSQNDGPKACTTGRSLDGVTSSGEIRRTRSTAAIVDLGMPANLRDQTLPSQRPSTVTFGSSALNTKTQNDKVTAPTTTTKVDESPGLYVRKYRCFTKDDNAVKMPTVSANSVAKRKTRKRALVDSKAPKPKNRKLLGIRRCPRITTHSSPEVGGDPCLPPPQETCCNNNADSGGDVDEKSSELSSKVDEKTLKRKLRQRDRELTRYYNQNQRRPQKSAFIDTMLESDSSKPKKHNKGNAKCHGNAPSSSASASSGSAGRTTPSMTMPMGGDAMDNLNLKPCVVRFVERMRSDYGDLISDPEKTSKDKRQMLCDKYLLSHGVQPNTDAPQTTKRQSSAKGKGPKNGPSPQSQTKSYSSSARKSVLKMLNGDDDDDDDDNVSMQESQIDTPRPSQGKTHQEYDLAERAGPSGKHANATTHSRPRAQSLDETRRAYDLSLPKIEQQGSAAINSTKFRQGKKRGCFTKNKQACGDGRKYDRTNRSGPDHQSGKVKVAQKGAQSSDTTCRDRRNSHLPSIFKKSSDMLLSSEKLREHVLANMNKSIELAREIDKVALSDDFEIINPGDRDCIDFGFLEDIPEELETTRDKSEPRPLDLVGNNLPHLNTSADEGQTLERNDNDNVSQMSRLSAGNEWTTEEEPVVVQSNTLDRGDSANELKKYEAHNSKEPTTGVPTSSSLSLKDEKDEEDNTEGSEPKQGGVGGCGSNENTPYSWAKHRDDASEDDDEDGAVLETRREDDSSTRLLGSNCTITTKEEEEKHGKGTGKDGKEDARLETDYGVDAEFSTNKESEEEDDEADIMCNDGRDVEDAGQKFGNLKPVIEPGSEDEDNVTYNPEVWLDTEHENVIECWTHSENSDREGEKTPRDGTNHKPKNKANKDSGRAGRDELGKGTTTAASDAGNDSMPVVGTTTTTTTSTRDCTTPLESLDSIMKGMEREFSPVSRGLVSYDHPQPPDTQSDDFSADQEKWASRDFGLLPYFERKLSPIIEEDKEEEMYGRRSWVDKKKNTKDIVNDGRDDVDECDNSAKEEGEE